MPAPVWTNCRRSRFRMHVPGHRGIVILGVESNCGMGYDEHDDFWDFQDRLTSLHCNKDTQFTLGKLSRCGCQTLQSCIPSPGLSSLVYLENIWLMWIV